MTFEARLADAFEAYAVGAPVAVDSGALTAELARRRQARAQHWTALPWPATRMWRVALVAALVAVAAIVSLLVAGAIVRNPPEPFGGGRILVWLPTSQAEATAFVVDASGHIITTRDMGPGGCPTWLGSGAAVVTAGFRSLVQETLDGSAVSGLSTDYVGMERWSPDRRSLALIDLSSDRVSVAHFASPTAEPDVVRYGDDGRLAGTVAAGFSEDGSRLALGVVNDRLALDIHVLEGGHDTVVGSYAGYVGDQVGLAMSPDGSRIAIVDRLPSQQPKVFLVDVAGRTIRDISPEVQPYGQAYLLSWSPEGERLAVGTGATMLVFDARTYSWTTAATTFGRREGETSETRWSDDPAHRGIAVIAGRHVDVYTFDGALEKHVPLGTGKAAFSPDGSVVASVGSLDGRPYQRGRPSGVWASDVWGDARPLLIATLPGVPSTADPDVSLTPCVDWASGG